MYNFQEESMEATAKLKPIIVFWEAYSMHEFLLMQHIDNWFAQRVCVSHRKTNSEHLHLRRVERPDGCS